MGFQGEALRLGVPCGAVAIETASTNTPENVRNTCAAGLLEGCSTVVAIATPYRQRRVMLTCRKHAPDICWVSHPPDTDLKQDMRVYADKGLDLVSLMIGEVGR